MRLRTLKHWLAQQDDDVLVDGGNPLLANLGSQGKEFFRLLQQQDSYNIDAFEEADPVSPVQICLLYNSFNKIFCTLKMRRAT